MWKDEYEKNRQEKDAADPSRKERRDARRRELMADPERQAARKAYMLAYYNKNRDKWTPRTRAQRDAYNATRREAYATDEAVRAKALADAKAWQEANPEKRKSQRLKQYGLSFQEFTAMVEAAGGRCQICGFSDTSNTNIFPLVDHCHATGVVRGIVCLNCNHGLGKFKDDPDRLRAAADYLLRSR